MGHHLETPGTNRIDNLGAFVEVRDLQFLLEKNGRLLIGRLNDAANKDMIRRR
jgi:hypothetical protein